MYVCVCIRVNCNLIRSNQQWSSLLISVALAGTRRRQRVCPAVVVVCLPPADGPRQRRRSAGRRARRPRASISPRGVGVGLESPSRRIDQEAAESDGARQAGRQAAGSATATATAMTGEASSQVAPACLCVRACNGQSDRQQRAELARSSQVEFNGCYTTTTTLPPLRVHVCIQTGRSSLTHTFSIHTYT